MSQKLNSHTASVQSADCMPFARLLLFRTEHSSLPAKPDTHGTNLPLTVKLSSGN